MKMRYILTVFLSLFLGACGLQLRNADSIPPALRCLYLESSNPYGIFHTTLAENLRGLHIILVKKPEQAPIHLIIVSNTLSHSDPGVVSTNMAVPYTFTLTTVAKIESANGKIISGPISLSTSRNIVINSNLVINSSMGVSSQQDLIRNNVTKLYFWLTSEEVKKALDFYANHPTRIKTKH